MERPRQKNPLAAVLVAGFFAAAVLHPLFMGEMMAASQSCLTGAVQTQNCQRGESLLCCASETSAMQTFLQASPQQLFKVTGALAAAAWALPLLLFLLYGSTLLVVLQSWLRMARRRISAFHCQIGSWLTVLEKRDPLHAPLWCRVKFAIAPTM